MVVREDGGISMMKPCPECDGEGRREYTRAVIDYVNGGYLEGYMDTCEDCGGYGEVEADEDEEEEQ
jgi:DnaJ-class molecular chaperone